MEEIGSSAFDAIESGAESSSEHSDCFVGIESCKLFAYMERWGKDFQCGEQVCSAISRQ
jgi:hypothetical protein